MDKYTHQFHIITHSPHLISNVLFVFWVVVFNLYQCIFWENVCLLWKHMKDIYMKQMLLNLFLRYLLCYLLIAIIIFCSVIWLAQPNGLFWYKHYFMPYRYCEAFSARPVICHHTKYIGTSHFTAGYLKVLNPPISLPSK